MPTRDDLHQFLRSRRSVRRFKPDPVPGPVLDSVLTTATYAPSAHNRQPWRFAVLTDPSTRDRFAQDLMAGFRHELELDGTAPDLIERKIDRSRQRILSAPVIIVLCVDMSDMETYPDPRRRAAEYLIATQSVASAGLQLLLAAHAEGLGGVWVCSPLFAQQIVRASLDLPAAWEPQAMCYLGYPERVPVLRQRRPVTEIMRRIEKEAE